MMHFEARLDALEIRLAALENDHDDMRLKVMLELAALRAEQAIARAEIKTALRVIGIGWGILLALIGVWLTVKGLK
jgi:hypothetical protein